MQDSMCVSLVLTRSKKNSIDNKITYKYILKLNTMKMICNVIVKFLLQVPGTRLGLFSIKNDMICYCKYLPHLIKPSIWFKIQNKRKLKGLFTTKEKLIPIYYGLLKYIKISITKMYKSSSWLSSKILKSHRLVTGTSKKIILNVKGDLQWN